jgi:hypothetical protein
MSESIMSLVVSPMGMWFTTPFPVTLPFACGDPLLDAPADGADPADAFVVRAVGWVWFASRNADGIHVL